MFSLFRRRKSSRRRSAHPATLASRRAAFIEQLEARLFLTGSGYTPSITITQTAQAPEGSGLSFTIAWSGVGQGGQLSYGTAAGTAVANVDYTPLSGGGIVGDSGSITVGVATKDDGNDPDFNKTVTVEVQLMTSVGASVDATGLGTILDTPGTPVNCTCSCSCGNVEASVTKQTGRPLVNSGQGGKPQDFYYVGDQLPHPVATVNDTLSSSVAQASDIMVQTTLDNLSGTVLYTSAPVYYSPAGYTAGQQVQFSQQLDATGLSDGTYQYVTTVSEQYGANLPIMRSYTDFVAVHNLDSSAYGSGWTLKNVDRLVPQSQGASLEDGSGNVFYFAINDNGQYDPPPERPDIASLVAGSGFTLTYRDGSQEIFSSAGLLTASIDKNNNKTTYTWNGDNTLARSPIRRAA